MKLLPREHGAYGQLMLPVATALAAAGPTAPALLLAISAVVAFVAHEPASVLLGLRGPRAERELRRTARLGLVAETAVAAVAAALAALSMDSAARWSLAVPFVPGLVLCVCSVRGYEKSWWGEVAAAVTFASLAVPVSMAGGAPASFAAAIGVPFMLLFVAGTLAVRTVILPVRGGGSVRATAITRGSVVTVAVAGTALLAWLAVRQVLPAATLVAVIPGLSMTLAVVARPPRPARLRAIGWSLVAAFSFAAAVLLATA